MEYIQEITLDLNTHSAPLIIGAKQNDVNSRILHIQFTKDGENYFINQQHSIGFRLRKPDQHFILDSGKSNSDGTVTIVLTKQCLTASGRGYADVVEYGDNGTILSTASFILDIQPSPGGNSLEEEALSSNEFIYLTDFIIRGNDIIGDSEKWAVGTKNGEPILNDDPAYNNYSKYWSQQANAWSNGQINGSDISSGPQKNNNAKYYSEEASKNSEQWATGTRGSVNVPSTNPAYHNNAKYYSEEAKNRVSDAISTMTFSLNQETGILSAIFDV